MKFKTFALIRYWAAPLFILMFIVFPQILFLFFLSSDWSIGEKLPLLSFAGILMLGGIALFHFDYWERCYAYLVITPDAIIRKCIFRRSIVIPRTECKFVGLEFETTPLPNEYPYIYFTSLNYPDRDNPGPVKIKCKEGLIKLRYTNQLAEYVMKEFSQITTYDLCSYYRKNKPKKKNVKDRV